MMKRYYIRLRIIFLFIAVILPQFFVFANKEKGGLSIFPTGPLAAYKGATINYALTVSDNDTDEDDEQMILVATFPREFSITSMSVTCDGDVTTSGNTIMVNWGAFFPGCTLFVTGSFDTIPCGGSGIINTEVKATSINIPSNPINATFDIFVPDSSVPFIDIEQSASSAVITNTEYVTYTLTVTNKSNNTATNVLLEDVLPTNLSNVSYTTPFGWTSSTTSTPGTQGTTVQFTIDSFAAGETAEFMITAKPIQASSYISQGILVNVPTVSAANFPFTNYATPAITVVTLTPSQFTAAASSSLVIPQESFSYQIVFSAIAAVASTLVVVLPQGVTFQGFDSNDLSLITLTSQAGQTLTFSISNPDKISPITFNVFANSTTSDVIVLPFYASLTANDQSFTTHSSVNNLLISYPDLAISMSQVPSIIAGQQITYPITVTNNGYEDATGVIVRVSLPTGLTAESVSPGSWSLDTSTPPYVTASLSGTLATGDSSTFFLTSNVDPSLPAGNITTTACVSCSIPDPDTSNNQASVTTAVTSQACLNLSKVSSDPVVNPEDVFSYTITAINNGPSAATTVMLMDQIPNTLSIYPSGITFPGDWTLMQTVNNLTFTNPSFSVGSATFTIPVNANQNIGPGQITNTATLSATNASPVSASSTIDSGSSVLRITKSLSSPCITSGNSYVYTITVTNTDETAVSFPVVTDTIPSSLSVGMITCPSGWTCTSSGNNVQFTNQMPLLAGESATFIIPVTANTSTTEAIANSASFCAEGLSAVQSTVGTCVNPNSSLVFSKSGPTNVIAGNNMTYTFGVSNNGSDAENVIVSDTFPEGVTFVSGSGTGWTITPTQGNGGIIATNSLIGANSMSTFSVIVQVASSATGTLENVALLSSSLNNSNILSTTVTTIVGTTAQVNLAKICPQSLTIGSTGLYQITVTNNGPSDAQDIIVTDTLPDGVAFVAGLSSDWNFSNVNNTVTATRSVLPAKSTSTFYIQVNATTLVSNTITNNASLTTSTPNTGTQTTSCSSALVGDTSDLAITQTATVNGSSIEYTITVTNLGPTINSNIEVIDSLPVGASYVSSSGTDWTFSYADGSLTATLPTLAIGASASFNLVVDPNENMSNQTLVNTAVVFGMLMDPDLQNNISTSEVIVNPLSDLAISQTAPDITGQSPLNYPITVTNLGPSNNTNIEVVDLLPQGVTFVSATGDGWSFGPVTNGTLTASLPSLAAGVSASFNLQVAVTNDTINQTLVNTASVSGMLVDPNLQNNVCSSTVDFTPLSDLAITQSAPVTVAEQSRIEYVITVTNLGPAANSTIEVVDVLPQGVTLISATGDGWNFGPVTNGNLTATLPTLAAGTSASFTLVVTVNKGINNQTLVNTARVSGTLVDPNLQNNISSSAVLVGPTSNISQKIISKYYCAQS